MTAQRRELEFQDLGEVIRELHRLRDNGYDRAGTWTLGQVSDHLAIFFRGSLDGFTQKVPWIIRALFGWMMFRYIIRRRAMPTGIKVPRSFLPQDVRDDRVAVDELTQLIDRFCEREGEYEPSPLFGNLTRDEWTQLHLIHCAHHISFLVPKE